MGIAVFKDDKLVGELSALETLCYNIIDNDIESCTITIPSPDEKSKSIDLFVYNKSKSKTKISIVNGTPFIKLDINLEAKISSIHDLSDKISENKLKEIADSANSYLESIMKQYLYKTSKEFKCDVNCFGRYALSKFTTTKKFNDYKWLENYKNSFFDVNVNTNIQSSFLLNGE